MSLPSDVGELLQGTFREITGSPGTWGIAAVDKAGNPIGGGGGSTTANQGTAALAAGAWPTYTTVSGSAIDPRQIRALTNSDFISISNFPATQPISAASLPLPTNAAQETGGNLAAAKSDLDAIATNTAGLATQTTLSEIATDTDHLDANLSTLATSSNQTNGTQKSLNNAQLVPVAFDTIQVTAVDGSDRPTTVLYKTGGLAGSTVATLTIVYDGSGNFQSVVRT